MSKPQPTSLDHREAELFRGRGRELELARGLWSAPLPADGRRILLFTGIGGIGKSALGRRIVREIGQGSANDGWLETAGPAFATIDLAEAASEDVVRALLQLRLQLGMTWREARFPLFDFAFARIHAERFPGSDVLRQYALLNPDGAVVRRLAPALPEALVDSERLQDAASGINELLAETPLIGTAYKYLNRVVAKGLDALDQRTEPLLQEIAGTDAALLDQRLPECLGLDLVNAIQTAERRRPITIVIDTLEAIHRRAPQQSGIGAFQNDAWLRELVWHAKGVGFILLGRDDVEWSSFEHSPVRDWQAVIDAHRLGELSDPEVASILAAFPIPDPDVAAAISEGAAGLPFYLGLQLDIHRDLVAEGVTPTAAHFARAPKAVLARFASHLGERLATAFTTLAHARRFDEPLFAHLKAHPGTLIGPVGLPEITRYSLIEGDPDRFFRLHQHFQDLQREELARTRPDDQRRIDKALFEYWDQACQPHDSRDVSVTHETALREAAHHLRLLAPPFQVRWLGSRWQPFLAAVRLPLLDELWRAALAAAEFSSGRESAETASALGSLSVVLRMQGALDEAFNAQKRALSINKMVHGRDGREAAVGLSNLGIILQMQGDLNEASKAHERALVILEKIHGPNHSEVAVSVGNLGIVKRLQGLLNDALTAQKRALAIKEKVYGPAHDEVASTLDNLGNVLAELGSVDEARTTLERSIKIKEMVYGPDHHEVAVTLNNLGIVLGMQGDFVGARNLLNSALAIYERIYGPFHYDVANTLDNLGIVLGMQGALAEAVRVQQRAFDINEMVYGRDHHKVAITLINLGVLQKRLDDLPAALAAEERALATFERRLPPTHPYIAQACENLADTLDQLGEVGRAEELRARAAAIRGGDAG